MWRIRDPHLRCLARLSLHSQNSADCLFPNAQSKNIDVMSIDCPMRCRIHDGAFALSRNKTEKERVRDLWHETCQAFTRKHSAGPKRVRPRREFSSFSQSLQVYNLFHSCSSVGRIPLNFLNATYAPLNDQRCYFLVG